MVLVYEELCIDFFIICSLRNIVLFIIFFCVFVVWNFIYKCRFLFYMEVVLELCEGKFNFKLIKFSFRDIMERKLCYLFVLLFFSFCVVNIFFFLDLNRKFFFFERIEKRI